MGTIHECMKKLASLMIFLSLATLAFGQNPMDRPMEKFPAGKETHIMCQEAWALLQLKPAEAPKLVVEALKSGNRQYSNAVLVYADETAGPKALVKAVKKAFPGLSDASRADVLYWIGRNRLTELQALVDASLNAGEAGQAAVFAAMQIGGAHNQALLDGIVKSDSPLAREVLRLRGELVEDDDDETRNSLRDSK